MHRFWNRSLVRAAVIAFALAPPRAHAQTPDRDAKSHWGLTFTLAPSWTVPPAFKKVPFDADTADVRGSDIELGFVRGRDVGGDWGVSLVRRSIKSGSSIERGFSVDCILSYCARYGNRYLAQNVSLLGVSIHKFVPFATIRRRAQIGVNFGGGVAQVRGSAEAHAFYPNYVTDPRGGFITGVTQGETVTQVNARELFVGKLRTLPLAKVEIAGAAILAAGLKVRVAGGLTFPAYPSVNVTLTYLFGARGLVREQAVPASTPSSLHR